jgi:hypothetical protein
MYINLTKVKLFNCILLYKIGFILPNINHATAGYLANVSTGRKLGNTLIFPLKTNIF